ncbi:MAG: carbohydrate ABC transporter permease [Sphaerochaetaceae bacterium]|nr:carbohydrate ABC transporter permease [Sphaerochaetaceae bacterium]
MKRSLNYKILKVVLLGLICLICIIPFYVLLVLSLNDPKSLFYNGNMFLPDFHLENYLEACSRSKIGRAMLNSAIITGGSLLLSIFCSGMAGYSISRRPSKINILLFSVLIGCMMIPGIINTVPLYTLMRKIHAVDTLWGMIFVTSTLSLPSGVFIFTTFIRVFPKELNEAAEIDGCTGVSAFWKVIFPLLKPATASFIILNGFGIWNNYAQAVFFLQSNNKHNVPQALSVFFQQFAGAKWHLVSATATIAIIPVVVIFLIFQKQFMTGLADGAIKG